MSKSCAAVLTCIQPYSPRFRVLLSCSLVNASWAFSCMTDDVMSYFFGCHVAALQLVLSMASCMPLFANLTVNNRLVLSDPSQKYLWLGSVHTCIRLLRQDVAFPKECNQINIWAHCMSVHMDAQLFDYWHHIMLPVLTVRSLTSLSWSNTVTCL